MPRSFKFKLLLIIVLLTSGSLLMYNNILAKDIENNKNNNTSYLINTSKCKIINLDPFNPIVMKYMQKLPKLECNETLSPLTAANNTSIWIVDNEYKDLECCYQSFHRITPKVGRSSDFKVKYSDCKAFVNATRMREEFIRVTCTSAGKPVYTNFHSFVFPNTKHQHQPKSPSVLIFGVDAVSRLNLIRQLPKTVKMLESLGAVQLYGYNKIGDNTFPNLMGVLSGQSAEELARTCWFKGKVFDPCSFIWDNFKSAGYQTAYGEEMNSWGTFASGSRRGFSKSPVDYYLRPFQDSLEREIGLPWNGDPRRCAGNNPMINVFLDHILKFVEKMLQNQKKYFGFFWSTFLTHTNVNIPSELDNIFVDYLTVLNNTQLNDTILIFMSDHGIRYGGIRETYQGYLEERLPFVYFIFPTWFKAKYSKAIENLQSNSYQLTSPFDLYHTLLDLVDVDVLQQQTLIERSKQVVARRGISLFLPIPDRSCEEAGIAESWCACTSYVSIPVDDEVVIQVGETIVQEINRLVKEEPQCRNVTLEKILSAELESRQTFKRKRVNSYILAISTSPNDAKFDARVDYDVHKHRYKVASYISRINLYGNQSYCTQDRTLKLYCQCL